MGIFSVFKKKKQTANDKSCEIEALAKKNSAIAVEFANEFNKTFDYSKNSIMELEEILDCFSNDIPESKPTENQIWSMSLIYGSYLGETMLKNGLSEKGYRWGKEILSNIPLLIGEDGGCLTPIDKVYKRLVNGNIDSVVSFYKFATEVLYNNGLN